MWENTGLALHKIEPEHGICGVDELANNQILSWNSSSILIWNQEGKLMAVLDDHTSKIVGVRLLASSRILTWDADAILRIWDIEPA